MKKYFEEVGRGLNEFQIDAIRSADSQEGFLKDILSELKNPQTDIRLGIRNGYFNLYVEGASLGKFIIDGGKISKIKIHKKYLDLHSSGYENLTLNDSQYNF
ncbi:MAG: hypothetical protein IJ728_02690 [Selenomonadaceae bacterium]|nr:hypothetical protein [Selenomonadaceae bacterium]